MARLDAGVLVLVSVVHGNLGKNAYSEVMLISLVPPCRRNKEIQVVEKEENHSDQERSYVCHVWSCNCVRLPGSINREISVRQSEYVMLLIPDIFAHFGHQMISTSKIYIL